MTFKNIFTSGFKFSDNDYELELKYRLFNSLLLFNILFILLLSFKQYLDDNFTYSLLTFISTFLGLGTLILARYSREYFHKLAQLAMFFSFSIVTTLFYFGLDLMTGSSLYLLLLIMVFFICRKKVGNIFFIASFLLILTIVVTRHQYEFSEILLAILPISIVLFFMNIYEKRNEHIKSSLKISNMMLSQHLNKSKKEVYKLQNILDKASVSIVISDSNGDIEYTNPWFSDITGYTAQEIKGKNPRVLKSDFHSDKYYVNLWEDITNDKVWSGTFKNLKKNGEEYWESAIISPVKNDAGEIDHYFSIKQEITKQVYLQEELNKRNSERIENFEKTIESFVQMVEERDTYTAGHSQRVAKYSRLIAQEMDCSQEDCDLIYRAGILHDIGKVATPDNVLLKPGELSDLEYKLIQEHVTASHDILKRIPMYSNLADIIICHHERYDGNGYPNGLKGNEIPLLSQIMIVADAFDAMTTSRIYKGRKSKEEAIVELNNLSGKQFHGAVVQSACVALADVVIEEKTDQLPKTELEKERFSYFYRDQVTDAYNADYLRFVLSKNSYENRYECLNMLYMKDFSHYNNKYGWDNGDKFLKLFVGYIIDRYPNTEVFRLHGDDFILISEKYVDVDIKEIENLKMLKDNGISIRKRHFNLKEENIIDINHLYQANSY